MKAWDKVRIMAEAMGAEHRTDCPYKAGTPEHKVWARSFSQWGKRDPEVVEAQRVRLEAQGRKVVRELPPKKEYDDPALDVLNVDDPFDLSMDSFLAALGVELTPYQLDLVRKIVDAPIIDSGPFQFDTPAVDYDTLRHASTWYGAYNQFTFFPESFVGITNC